MTTRGIPLRHRMTNASTLPEAMTGKASSAKAAVGDKPVFAHIASLPQPRRGIAEAVGALAAITLPHPRLILRG